MSLRNLQAGVYFLDRFKRIQANYFKILKSGNDLRCLGPITFDFID